MTDVVAVVRLRERNRSAIGVCESPPVLELGSSALEVLARIKARLQAAIEPSSETQLVMVIRDDTGGCVVEALR